MQDVDAASELGCDCKCEKGKVLQVGGGKLKMIRRHKCRIESGIGGNGGKH